MSMANDDEDDDEGVACVGGVPANEERGVVKLKLPNSRVWASSA